jgi:hypothetical protein
MNRLAIIILLILAASLLACEKKREFKTFGSGLGRFEIATPTELENTSKPYDFEGIEVTQYVYAADIDNVAYALTWFDIPEPINAQLKKRRKSPYDIPGRDALLKEHGWKAVDIRGDSHQLPAPCKEDCEAAGEWFKVITNRQVIYVRMLWFRNRIYHIISAHPKDPSYLEETNASKFLWSFKIFSGE